MGCNAGAGVKDLGPFLEMKSCQKAEIFTLPPVQICAMPTSTSSSAPLSLEKACGNGKHSENDDKCDPKYGMACHYASIN